MMERMITSKADRRGDVKEEAIDAVETTENNLNTMRMMHRESRNPAVPMVLLS